MCFQFQKGGNLDFTSGVICAGCNQIMNFESRKWPPVATFKSWRNESALSFFDFALFHGQKQVLSQIVTFLKITKRASWKFEKIEESDFCKLHVPGVMNVQENWSSWFLWSFMYLGSLNSKKLKLLIFARFHLLGVMKVRAPVFGHEIGQNRRN